MDGFDPVAHYEGAFLRGEKQYSFAIGDVTYYFANTDNLEKFESEPGRYIPTAGAIPVGSNVKGPQPNQDENGYIGNKTFESRRGLEDAQVSLENNVPIDIKEDGDVEMQNLSDDNN